MPGSAGGGAAGRCRARRCSSSSDTGPGRVRRNAGRRAADREHDQADDRLRHASSASRSPRRLVEQPYDAGPRRVARGRARRARLRRRGHAARRCCCRAATTSPTRSRSTSAAASPHFVALMNRWPQLRCTSAHALHDADRARHARQLLDRARPRAARRDVLLRDPLVATHRAQAHRATRRRRRRAQPQRPARRLPVGRRRQDRAHRRRRLLPGRRGAPARRPPDQRRARRAERRGPRRRHARAAALRPERLSPRADRVRRARATRRSPVDGAAQRGCARRRERSLRSCSARGATLHVALQASRARSTARCAAGTQEGELRRQRRSGRDACRRVPLVTRDALSAPTGRRTGRDRRLVAAVRLYGPACSGCSLRVMRRRATRSDPVPCDHHRHAQRRDRQVAFGSELPARAAPPDRRAARARRRQGRERRAHAQDARRAGDRHRLRRRADRDADRRAADARGVDPPRLRAASARSRAPTPPVLDPTTGEQTEINEQGPTVDAGGARAVSREAPLPRARRGDRRLRRLAAARGRARLLRAARARVAQARRDDVVDTDGRARCARRCAPSRTS